MILNEQVFLRLSLATRPYYRDKFLGRHLVLEQS